MKRLVFYRYFAVLATVIAMTGCNAVPVEPVKPAAPIVMPADVHPAPVIFLGLRYAVPLGTNTVGTSVHSLSCALAYHKSQRRVALGDVPMDDYRRVFGESLGALGYDVAGNPDRIFDADADQERATYDIAGRVTDIKIDGCREAGSALLFKYDAGEIGEAMMQVEWTVFDALDQRNVYRVTTRGYAKLDDPSDTAEALLLQDSFAAAAHNLGADHAFYDLMVNGIKPANAPATAEDREEEPLADAGTPATLPRLPLRERNAAADIDNLRQGVVMIQNAVAMGSGFFISRDGLILTDRHVVGNARRVRIVTADKRFKLIADVVRTNAKRDVALLRLENIPDGFVPHPLSLRREKPKVAEDVYAIGSPESPHLQDTVTKGIVSALRYHRQEKQWYIQSDVYTYHGNSGGPLLDAHGNVIGLSEAGYVNGGQDLSGLNLFTPIDDALKALEIR